MQLKKVLILPHFYLLWGCYTISCFIQLFSILSYIKYHINVIIVMEKKHRIFHPYWQRSDSENEVWGDWYCTCTNIVDIGINICKIDRCCEFHKMSSALHVVSSSNIYKISPLSCLFGPKHESSHPGWLNMHTANKNHNWLPTAFIPWTKQTQWWRHVLLDFEEQWTYNYIP